VDLVDEEHVVALEVGEDGRPGPSAFSSTGPEVWRRFTPSSLRDDVRERRLAQPGGPNSSTWSIASLRILAAPMKISSCSRALAWPTYSASPLGRSATLDRFLVGRRGAALTTAACARVRNRSVLDRQSRIYNRGPMSSATILAVQTLRRSPDSRWALWCLRRGIVLEGSNALVGERVGQLQGKTLVEV
jgi:hypothetical protein